LLEEFGSDLTRINIISSAEGLSDADWRGENVKTFLERINFIFSIIDSFKNMKFMKNRNIDKFLVSRINEIGKASIEAYENLKFRTATQLLFFEFLNDIDWYFKRVGSITNANKNVLRSILKKFTILVSPLIPHLSEEIWEKIGGKNFVFKAGIPKFEKVDERVILKEKFLQNLIEDIREIGKLVEEKPKEIYIIVASEWKFDLVKKLMKGIKIEVKDLLTKFEEREREHVAKFYRKILNKIESKKFISRNEELEILKEAKEFLEREFKTKIIISVEEKSGLEKAKQAEPFKPSIYFSV
jgi:leucyl-tRNA synthetase